MSLLLKLDSRINLYFTPEQELCNSFDNIALGGKKDTQYVGKYSEINCYLTITNIHLLDDTLYITLENHSGSYAICSVIDGSITSSFINKALFIYGYKYIDDDKYLVFASKNII